MRSSLVAIALLTAALTPDVAESQITPGSIKFCFRLYLEYNDDGFALPGTSTTEDYWIDTQHRWFRGGRVTVFRDNTSTTPIFDDFLGDGLGSGDPGPGCTSTMVLTNVDRTYIFWIRPWTAVNGGNTLFTVDQENVTHTLVPLPYNHSQGSGTFTRVYDPGVASATHAAMFRVAMAGTYSLWRHNGGMTSQSYNAMVWECFGESSPPCEDVPPDGGTKYNSDEQRVEISEARSHRKFVISHEMGRHLLDYKAPDKTSQDCSLSATDCPADANEHSMGSLEWSNCAFTEGWAHFYAADTWNSHSQLDCVFRYYKGSNRTVDCEGTQTPAWPVGYIGNVCTVSSHDGRGVELDWLRQFWDVHTNQTGSPSFTDMANWVRDASSWNKRKAYTELDKEADTVGGTLDENWDNTKLVNQVNH